MYFASSDFYESMFLLKEKDVQNMKKKISALFFSLFFAGAAINFFFVPAHINAQTRPVIQQVSVQQESEDEEVQTDEEESSGFYDSATQIIFSAALVFCILGIYALKRNKIL
jgi:ABC-type multidrug transport system permease subunit